MKESNLSQTELWKKDPKARKKKEGQDRRVMLTKKKLGENHFKRVGRKSPTKFNSDTARAAANRRWEQVREQERQNKNDRED